MKTLFSLLLTTACFLEAFSGYINAQITQPGGGVSTAAGVVALFTGCSGTQSLGADGACHAAGAGTVTNTGGNLTANSVLLGAGVVDTKVSTGITTNGVAELDVGVVGTSGVLGLNGTTSGKATLTAPAVAGTASNAVVATNAIQGPVLTGPTFQWLGGGNPYGIGDDSTLWGPQAPTIWLNGTRGAVWNATQLVLAQTGALAFAANINVSSARDVGISRTAAGVLAVGNAAQGDETGLVRAGNPCRVTSVVNLTTAGGATNICSWSLPAVAKTWAWQCQGTYGVTSGTTPAVVIGMNASQIPTSETGSGVIATVSAGATIVESNGTATSTSAGDVTLVTTGGAITTITNGLWSSFGTIQASATAGTFAIRGTITGTTAVGTINVGTTCLFY
jgi:hypothetical protein